MRSVTVRGPELDPALFIQQVNGMLMVLTAGGTVNRITQGELGTRLQRVVDRLRQRPEWTGTQTVRAEIIKSTEQGKVRYQNGGFVVPVVVLPNRIYEFRGL